MRTVSTQQIKHKTQSSLPVAMALNAVMEPEKISLLKNLTKFGKAIQNGLIDLDSVHRMIHEIPDGREIMESSPLDGSYTRQQKWSEVLQFMQANPNVLMSLLP